MSNEPKGFETTWAVVELMGHRKIAGQVSETVVGGTSIMRVDVPKPDGNGSTTQFYGWQSLYCLTPVTEEIARAYSIRNQPQPVSPWELPTALPKPAEPVEHEDELNTEWNGDDEDEDEHGPECHCETCLQDHPERIEDEDEDEDEGDLNESV